MRIEKELGGDLMSGLGREVEVFWFSPADGEGESGILASNLKTPSGVVKLD